MEEKIRTSVKMYTTLFSYIIIPNLTQEVISNLPTFDDKKRSKRVVSELKHKVLKGFVKSPKARKYLVRLRIRSWLSAPVGSTSVKKSSAGKSLLKNHTSGDSR